MAALARAFPNGSPICNSNATAIQAAKQMGTLQANLGFTLDTSSFPGGKYTPGKQYKVSVKGTQQFTGILLYAVNADKTNHPGMFAIMSGYKAVSPQNGPACPGMPAGTITQSDATPKGPNVDMMWTAPTNDAGPLSFLGVAVTGGGKGFQLLKSDNTITSSGGTAGNTTTTGGNSTASGNTTMSGNGSSGYGSGTGTTTDNSTNSGSGSGSGSGNNPTSSTGAQSSTSDAGVLIANHALLLTQFFVGAVGVYLFGLIAI